MNRAAFLSEVCRRAGEPLESRDPLAVAYSFLDACGDTAEGQLLRRIIYAISHDIGDFEAAEVWLLSKGSLQIDSGLVETRLSGQYTARQWVRLDKFRTCLSGFAITVRITPINCAIVSVNRNAMSSPISPERSVARTSVCGISPCFVL